MALKVITFFAGPGAGKSTLAAALFAAMKRQRFSVELVTEVAKDYTYEKAWTHLGDQFNVLAQQNFRLTRLQGKVEWAITDSPLPLTLIYCKESQRPWFRPIVTGLWNQYENYPFILQRTRKPFQEFGRNQNLEESMAIDARTHVLAEEFGALATLDPDAENVEQHILKQLEWRQAA